MKEFEWKLIYFFGVEWDLECEWSGWWGGGDLFVWCLGGDLWGGGDFVCFLGGGDLYMLSKLKECFECEELVYVEFNFSFEIYVGY